MNTIEQAVAPDPQLNFVFWRHIDKNAPLVIPKLVNADIILLEDSPFTDKRERKIRDALANFVMGNEISEGQMNMLSFQFGDEVKNITYSLDVSKQVLPTLFQPLVVGIIDNFHGKGKELHFLDANTKEHAELVQDINSVFEAQKDVSQAVQDGDITSFDELQQKTKEILQKQGQHVGLRDEIIKDQIKAYAEAEPDKKIAIVYGMNHSGLSHEFIQDGQAQRVFVGRHSGQAQYFNLDSQAQRYARFGREIPDSIVRRILAKSIMYVLMTYSADPEISADTLQQYMKTFDPDAMSLLDVCDSKAQSMDDAELEQFAKLYDACLKDLDDQAARAQSEQFFRDIITRR